MFLESDSHSLLDAVRLLLSDADLHRPGRIENVIDKRGLARAEKSGNDRYGDFSESHRCRPGVSSSRSTRTLCVPVQRAIGPKRSCGVAGVCRAVDGNVSVGRLC
jgi:hypothetical protein